MDVSPEHVKKDTKELEVRIPMDLARNHIFSGIFLGFYERKWERSKARFKMVRFVITVHNLDHLFYMVVFMGRFIDYRGQTEGGGHGSAAIA